MDAIKVKTAVMSKLITHLLFQNVCNHTHIYTFNRVRSQNNFRESSSDPLDRKSPPIQQMLSSNPSTLTAVCGFSIARKIEPKHSSCESPYAVTFNETRKGKKKASLCVTAICRQFPKLRRFFHQELRGGGDERRGFS
jgi:hypothetical protein